MVKGGEWATWEAASPSTRGSGSALGFGLFIGGTGGRAGALPHAALPPERSSSSRKTGAETLLIITSSWLHMIAIAARRGGVRGGGPLSKKAGLCNRITCI